MGKYPHFFFMLSDLNGKALSYTRIYRRMQPHSMFWYSFGVFFTLKNMTCAFCAYGNAVSLLRGWGAGH